MGMVADVSKLDREAAYDGKLQMVASWGGFSLLKWREARQMIKRFTTFDAPEEFYRRSNNRCQRSWSGVKRSHCADCHGQAASPASAERSLLVEITAI